MRTVVIISALILSDAIRTINSDAPSISDQVASFLTGFILVLIVIDLAEFIIKVFGVIENKGEK